MSLVGLALNLTATSSVRNATGVPGIFSGGDVRGKDWLTSSRRASLLMMFSFEVRKSSGFTMFTPVL